MSEEITRKDVDELSTHILINLGIINAAAIGAVLASNTVKFTAAPFAVGLISAIVSQLIWYVDIAIDYAFDGEEIFSDHISNVVWTLLIFFLVIGTGCISAACIVYGCLVFLEDNDALFHSTLTFILIFVVLFYILVRKGWKNAVRDLSNDK